MCRCVFVADAFAYAASNSSRLGSKRKKKNTLSYISVLRLDEMFYHHRQMPQFFFDWIRNLTRLLIILIVSRDDAGIALVHYPAAEALRAYLEIKATVCVNYI